MPSNKITSPKIEEMKRHKKKRLIILLVILFFVLIGLIVGLSFLSRNSKMAVDNIQVVGTHIIDADAVKEAVQSDLSGKYLHLFARRNTFIFPRKKIASDLRHEF